MYQLFCHAFLQVSAYSAFARIGVGLGLEQRRRMDPTTNEPLFTNCTRDFIGTHDYIFYSGILDMHWLINSGPYFFASFSYPKKGKKMEVLLHPFML